MGEAKRREQLRSVVDGVTKRLTDEGKIIEAGWVSMKMMTFPDVTLPEAQEREMRMAFFAGAQHLFGSIMSILDPGEEPTAADLRRMDLINNELQSFIADFQMKHCHTEGSA